MQASWATVRRLDVILEAVGFERNDIVWGGAREGLRKTQITSCHPKDKFTSPASPSQPRPLIACSLPLLPHTQGSGPNRLPHTSLSHLGNFARAVPSS